MADFAFHISRTPLKPKNTVKINEVIVLATYAAYVLGSSIRTVVSVTIQVTNAPKVIPAKARLKEPLGAAIAVSS